MVEQRALAPAAGLLLALSLLLAGCASGPRSGRDGVGANPPSDLAQLPDAEPRVEAIRGSGGTSKPYTVLGQSYVPITDDRPFRESGLASWYGKQFHALSTASGEPYDMYAMTAAHKTLPLPSYVRVRNPANGKEVIVRVNDRGPFHEGRVIDLSYAAALKLDLLRGVAPVEIERITNQDIRAGTWRRGTEGTMLASAAPMAPAAAPVAMAAAVPVQDSRAASGEVVVPAAMTMPVVAASQPEVMSISALPPMSPITPLAPAAPSAAAQQNMPTTGDVATSDTPLASPSPGFWVQLGAFSQRDGASAFRQQVTRNMPSLASTLNVFSERGVYRVQSGPYASREAAGGTADAVRNGMQLAPIVVERR